MPQDTYAALRAIDAHLFFARALRPGDARRDAHLDAASRITSRCLDADARQLAEARELSGRLARLQGAAGVPL